MTNRLLQIRAAVPVFQMIGLYLGYSMLHFSVIIAATNFTKTRR